MPKGLLWDYKPNFLTIFKSKSFSQIYKEEEEKAKKEAEIAFKRAVKM